MVASARLIPLTRLHRTAESSANGSNPLEKPRSTADSQADVPPGWSRKGKLVLVIRLLNGRGGGAERLFCEMANMFDEAGYEVTCIYCDSSPGSPFFPISRRVAVINLWHRAARSGAVYGALDHLAKHLPPTGGSSLIDWFSKNLFFIRRLAAAVASVQPDLVISFLPPANTPSVIAARLAGAKVLPTNHNVPEQDFRSPLRWDQNPVDRFLRLHVLRYATRVHVLLPSFLEWFPESIRKRGIAITNYVSRDFENVELPERRQKTIVGVGRLAPVKNYGALIDAWALIAKDYPEWSVEIHGSGPDHQRLLHRVRELKLSSVHLRGQTSSIKDVYLAGEIFCHPAHHEGFGLAVAEALACGLPAVAYSDCPGVNELVQHEVNGLLVARSGGPAALAAALRRLIEDESLRTQLRERAPITMRAFSFEAFRRNWLSLVEDITSKARAA